MKIIKKRWHVGTVILYSSTFTLAYFTALKVMTDRKKNLFKTILTAHNNLSQSLSVC